MNEKCSCGLTPYIDREMCEIMGGVCLPELGGQVPLAGGARDNHSGSIPGSCPPPIQRTMAIPFEYCPDWWYYEQEPDRGPWVWER